jgi:uncharacterized protein YgiM (DUF1202 family)
MKRKGIVSILFLSFVLLACQLQYALSPSDSSASPRPTRTRTPRPGETTVPPTSAAPPPVPFLPGGSAIVTATTKENLRVRAAPSASSQQLGLLNKGDTVQVIGRTSASDWWQISLPSNPGTKGWILASFTDVNGPIDSIPVVSPGVTSPPAPAQPPYPGSQPPVLPPNPYP